VLDDDVLSEMEVEAEAEAWDSWLRDDIIRELPDRLRGIAHGLLKGDKLWDVYQKAKEKTNTDVVIETGGGVYVDIQRLLPAFRNLLSAKRGNTKVSQAQYAALKPKVKRAHRQKELPGAFAKGTTRYFGKRRA